MVNHRDSSFLPTNPADVRDLNLVCSPPSASECEAFDSKEGGGLCVVALGYAMATHVINPLSSKSSSPKPIFQTTNPLHPPAPESIISIARIERAVLAVDSKAAQRDLITVGRGRWVLLRSDSESSSRQWWWRGWRVEHVRSRKLGALQAPGRRKVESGETGVPGIWLCGSYAHPGIPLLEACVTSALAIVEGGIFELEGVGYKPRWAVH